MLQNHFPPTHSRRQLLHGMTLALSGIACEPLLRGQASSQATQETPTPGDHRTALHQDVELHATAAQIQGVLLDAKQFSGFTKLAATIDPTEGGAFSLFGGVIVGRNVEIVPATRIVQAWRPTHWEPGMYSLVRFALKAQDKGTLVVLDHTGFPEGDYDSLFSGWQSHYWEPLRTQFA
jgi:activator of HSP90 ATPase